MGNSTNSIVIITRLQSNISYFSFDIVIDVPCQYIFVKSSIANSRVALLSTVIFFFIFHARKE